MTLGQGQKVPQHPPASDENADASENESAEDQLAAYRMTRFAGGIASPAPVKNPSERANSMARKTWLAAINSANPETAPSWLRAANKRLKSLSKFSDKYGINSRT